MKIVEKITTKDMRVKCILRPWLKWMLSARQGKSKKAWAEQVNRAFKIVKGFKGKSGCFFSAPDLHASLRLLLQRRSRAACTAPSLAHADCLHAAGFFFGLHHAWSPMSPECPQKPPGQHITTLLHLLHERPRK